MGWARGQLSRAAAAAGAALTITTAAAAAAAATAAELPRLRPPMPPPPPPDEKAVVEVWVRAHVKRSLRRAEKRGAAAAGGWLMFLQAGRGRPAVW